MYNTVLRIYVNCDGVTFFFFFYQLLIIYIYSIYPISNRAVCRWRMCIIFLFKTWFRIVIAAAQGLKNNFRATQFRWNFLLVLRTDNGLYVWHTHQQHNALAAARQKISKITARLQMIIFVYIVYRIYTYVNVQFGHKRTQRYRCRLSSNASCITYIGVILYDIILWALYQSMTKHVHSHFS